MAATYILNWSPSKKQKYIVYGLPVAVVVVVVVVVIVVVVVVVAVVVVVITE